MKRIITCLLVALAIGLANPASAQEWNKQKEQQLKELNQKSKAEKAKLDKMDKNSAGYAEQDKKYKDIDRKRETLQKEHNVWKSNQDKQQQAQQQAQQPNDDKQDSPVQPQETAKQGDDTPEQVNPMADAANMDVTPTANQGATTPDTTTTEIAQDAKGDQSTPWWMQLLAMLAVAGVCSGAVFVVLNNKLVDTQRKLKASMKKDNAELTSRLQTLIDKTDRIESSVSSVRRDMMSASVRTQSAPQPPARQQPVTTPPAQPAGQPTVFYFSMPGSDGTWREATTAKKASQSLYQMTSEDGVHGRFVVLNEPIAVQMITMQVAKYLNPVCRMTNTLSQVSGIVTDEPGIVVKENGVWRVTKKAEAHYV